MVEHPSYSGFEERSVFIGPGVVECASLYEFEETFGTFRVPDAVRRGYRTFLDRSNHRVGAYFVVTVEKHIYLILSEVQPGDASLLFVR